MRLILVRHAETEENVNGIIMGHAPGVLTESGKEQSEKIGHRLRDEKIDVICYSDLARSFDTSKAIIKNHPEAILIESNKISERNYGRFQGMSKKVVDWQEADKEIEPLINVQAKFVDFVTQLQEIYSDKTVVIVSHGAAMRSFVAHVNNTDVNEPYDTSKPGNTAVYIYAINNQGIVSEMENNMDHL